MKELQKDLIKFCEDNNIEKGKSGYLLGLFIKHKDEKDIEQIKLLSDNDRQKEAINYMMKHIEDFGEEKWKRTGDIQSIGRLAYSCVNVSTVLHIMKIMQGYKESNNR